MNAALENNKKRHKTVKYIGNGNSIYRNQEYFNGLIMFRKLA
ncbi:hypothetical protein T4E_10238 [Trichinella pseudospiralis]|uniref:Uncharacterized protein n=1 Tax=Trichinella pseudospiralis TaxID=6337 RepID=A0A0V0XDS7_TRIPS|nr:hypothetical protein T4E_10238 [Trichinella pseudospiralis]